MYLDPYKRIAELEEALAERDARIAALEKMVSTLLLKVEELEARLKQNSNNSNLPPSANPPGAPPSPPKKPTGRKPGGQPGHRGHHRAVVVPDVEIDYHPERCAHCQSVFCGDESEIGEPFRHQVTEIPPVRPFVTEHRLHRKRCPKCRHATLASLPSGIPSGQFGPRIVSLVALLSGRYRITRREVTAFLRDGLGLSLSLGSVQNLCELASKSLAIPYEEVAKAVLMQPVVHADETGWRHKGKKAWLWTASGKGGAVFKLAPGRGHESRRLILPDDYGGVVVSDRWHAYERFERRSLCHAHLLRNWRAISERKDCEAQTVGKWGVDETDRMLRLHRQYREGTLSRKGFSSRMRMLKARYARLLNRAEECKDSKVQTLVAGLNRQWAYLWTFIKEEEVEPTNNEAERAIRPAVLWRKGSFGTNSDEGQRFVERMLTIAATARKFGVSLFEFIFDACKSSISQLPAPSFYRLISDQTP